MKKLFLMLMLLGSTVAFAEGGRGGSGGEGTGEGEYQYIVVCDGKVIIVVDAKASDEDILRVIDEEEADCDDSSEEG